MKRNMKRKIKHWRNILSSSCACVHCTEQQLSVYWCLSHDRFFEDVDAIWNITYRIMYTISMMPSQIYLRDVRKIKISNITKDHRVCDKFCNVWIHIIAVVLDRFEIVFHVNSFEIKGQIEFISIFPQNFCRTVGDHEAHKLSKSLPVLWPSKRNGGYFDGASWGDDYTRWC